MKMDPMFEHLPLYDLDLEVRDMGAALCVSSHDDFVPGYLEIV